LLFESKIFEVFLVFFAEGFELEIDGAPVALTDADEA